MRFAAAVLLLIVASLPARALETDQYYAWTRHLDDASAAINRKINAEIAIALKDVNERLGADECSCDRVRKAIRHRFSWLLFQKPEMWVVNTSQVDRVPKAPAEELSYRHDWLYGATSPFDPIKFMPPSPTIEIDGVRIGTDKISHFFSEGAWLFISYHYYKKMGRPDDEAVLKALSLGLAGEKGILGLGASGIFSLADQEANYQGLLFWQSFCFGPDPNLEKTPQGWRVKRPFDIAAYVSPEWDESWQPNIYTPSRWKKVLPVIVKYCPLLDDPLVQARRQAYAARGRYTASEQVIHALVESGKLEDPRRYTIEAVCGRPLRDVLAPPDPPGNHR
ncbi:MAG TPA: hypothetical protein VFV19_05775 [Candidatus Polarisedimenticolaceae bacterium]|nr:hypothetical protein [Candidatus Polarisedimenticolaceae bacterium]